MNQDRAVAWLRGALERRVGAATRSLVAAVQAAADAASNVEELQKALENDLQFASLDAEFIAKGFLERLAEEIPSSGVPEASKESQVDQDNKKRRLAEDAVAKPVANDTGDAAEAAAFAARLRARDAASGRKVGAARIRQEQLEREEAEAAEAAAAAAAPVPQLLTEEDLILEAKKRPNEKLRGNAAYMQRLREEARRAYLKKREVDQVILQERKIQDREWLYKQVESELTEEERRDLELRKETLELARKAIQERRGRGEIEGYVMPEAYDDDLQARLKVMHQPYQEPKHQMTEQEIVEKQKTQAAIVHFGAKSGRTPEQKTEYKLIDESGAAIEFEASEVYAPSKTEELLLRGPDDEEQRRAKVTSLQEERRLLPVYGYREEFLRAVAKHRVLIVVGETGSGKTTQLPQYLREVGYAKAGRIGCTQPRRIAAMSVAARVSQEIGCRLGLEVGYSIRFEDCTSDKTELKYMTDGMLLREFLTEPDLQSYSALMIDEAHERTLHTDVLFALVKDLSRYREDFRLIVSSATLEAEKFSIYFDDAPIFRIPGRRYPVQIYYTKSPEANFLDAAVVTSLQIHFTQPLGDILVFLPGQLEVDEAVEEVQKRMRGRGSEVAELIVLPLYSALPSDQQARVFEKTPPGARKEMEDANVPEIQRANLSHVVLALKSLGIDDLLKFDFMDPPAPEALISALELLYALAALNDQGELTKLGRRMAEFPLDPMFSKMVVNSEKYGCVLEALTICAMLGVGSMLFYRPKDKAIHADNARKTFARPGGDPLTLLNVYDQWEDTGFSVAWCYENFIQHRALQRARDVREQLQGLLERVELEEKSCEGGDEPIRKAITSGFFTQAARLNRHGSFTTLKHPHTVEIHPHSSLFGQHPRFVVYTELALTTKEYMRSVCEVKPEWLAEVAPHFYKQQELQVGKLPKAFGKSSQQAESVEAAYSHQNSGVTLSAR